MNIWVEFFMYDEKQISRRFFSTMTAATEFAKVVKKKGNMVRIKQDGGGY